MKTSLISLGIGMIGSLIAAALFPGIQTWSMSVLTRLIGWIPRRRGAFFGGRWEVEWHVESFRYAPIELDRSVRLHQLGNRLYAKFRAGGIDCYLIGTVDAGRYVTGTWYDATEGGYHGAFQLVI